MTKFKKIWLALYHKHPLTFFLNFRFSTTLLFLLLSFFFSNTAFSQSTYTISGHVRLEGSFEPATGAKISVTDFGKSTNKSWGMTDSTGNFRIEHITNDSIFTISASFIYHNNFTQTIQVTQRQILMDTILLQQDENLLDLVEVVAKKTAIIIKEDTLLFDVASFEVSDDANVENLLEVLPGVTVDANGVIRVNGKEVDKILVNGKPFFGSDLTIATRNLTKDMLTTVEITNTTTKAEDFTGDQGDQTHKTINLILKKDISKGYFGELSSGYGIEDRYDLNGMINYFNEARRISVVSGANNINSPRYSAHQNSSSTDSYGQSGANGIVTSGNVGLNYSDEFKKTISFESYYFSSTTSNANSESIFRENIQPSNLSTSSSNRTSFLDKTDHRLNLNLSFNPTEKTLIDIKIGMTTAKKISQFDLEEFSSDEFGNLINLFTNRSNTTSINSRITSSLSAVHKLKRNGSHLKFTYKNDLSLLTGNGINYSETFFTFGAPNILRSQLIDNLQEKVANRTTLSYKLPIKLKSLSLTLQAIYDSDQLSYNKSVFNNDEMVPPFHDLDTNLSNIYTSFESDFSSNLNLSINRKKWKLNIKPSYVYRTRNNSTILRPNQSNERFFSALEFKSNFNYKVNTKFALNGEYNLNNSPPSLNQLLDFRNEFIPLNTIIGNPNLVAQKTHNITFGGSYYDFAKRQSLFAYISGHIKENQIIEKTEIDTNLIKEVTYANVSGSYGIAGTAVWDKKFAIDSISTTGLKVTLSNSFNRSINSVNAIEYSNYLWLATPNIGVFVNWRNKIDLKIEYQHFYIKTFFELEELEGQGFNRNQVSIFATFSPLQNLKWQNNIYTTFEFGKNAFITNPILLWNSTISYLLKKPSIKLSLKMYDVLNRNQSILRTITPEYREEKETLVLDRYLMFYVTWKIKNHS